MTTVVALIVLAILAYVALSVASAFKPVGVDAVAEPKDWDGLDEIDPAVDLLLSTKPGDWPHMPLGEALELVELVDLYRKGVVRRSALWTRLALNRELCDAIVRPLRG